MDLDILASAFASTDHVFTPAMADAVGVSPRRVASLRRAGYLTRLAGQGHVLTSVTPTAKRRAIAAILTWPDAVVCLRTAGDIHGLLPPDDGIDRTATDVLVPNGRRPCAGITPHYWSVSPMEVAHLGIIQLTDRRTTLADLLTKFDDWHAWGVLAWVWTRDLVTLEDLEAQIQDRRYLHGVVRLRAMAAAIRDGAVSIGEVRFHEFLRDRGFVGWTGDRKIYHGGRVVARADVLFAALGVIIEFDGVEAHSASQRAADLARDAMLRRLGYVVEHVTWGEMYERPRDVMSTIRSALAEGARRRAAKSASPMPTPLRVQRSEQR